MRVSAQKSRYHRFTFTYEFTKESLEFCRILKDSFGWDRFHFDSADGLKRWVFSETFFIKLLMERFPNLEVDADVLSVYQHEMGIVIDEQKKQELTGEIRKKKETEFRPKGIKGEMYPYQRVGIEFLLASGGRAIIADPPGLGKTVQALGYATHLGLDRTLVICPASVKSAWVKEIEKWTNLSYEVIDSSTKLDKIPAKTKVWIINYDILKKHYEQLIKTKFDLMVADECHLVKNHLAIRTKAVRGLARNIPHVVLLSGTPLLSRPVEMFTLLNMIDPRTWNNWYSYTREYCGGHQGYFGYDVSGATNVEQLHEKIRKYFIRRPKSEVLSQLPPKNRIDVQVEFDKDTRKKYDKAEDDFVSYLKEYSGKQPREIAKMVQAEKLAQINILRYLCAMGKLKAAEDIIDAAIEADEKILVFSSYMEPLDYLMDKYVDKVVRITGQTPVEDRGKIVDEFQNDPNIKVFLGGIKSAGVGITLTAASNVLFLDYSWNPADHQQAEDRVHRPGQVAQSVNIYQLFADNTIDGKLKKMLDKKRKIFDKVIEGGPVEEVEKDAMDEVVDDLLKRRHEKAKTKKG